MRPPKVVVLVGADERKLSVRAFLFRTTGYKVATAATAKEALAVLQVLGAGLTGDPDLLVVDLPLGDFDAGTIAEAMRLQPGLRTLVTDDHSYFYDPCGADGMLTRGYTPADLLERCHVLCARKRGPRKATACPASPGR
jgi:DNA-binding response OmpR family regulator